MKNIVSVVIVVLLGLSFTMAEVHIWKGSAGPNGRDWDNANNWVGTSNTIPWWDEDIIIPSAGVVQYPLLNVHAGAKNLLIEPSASIDLGTHMFFVQKNIVNHGSFLATNGTLVFYGSEDAEVDGALNVRSLTVIKDNRYSILIKDGMTINSVMELEQGLLISGLSPILLGPNAIVTGNYGEVSGSVVRTLTGAGTWQFTRTMMSLTTGGTQPTVTVTVTSHPGVTIPTGDPSLAIRRYYEIEVSGGALSASARLPYLDSELNGLSEADLTSFRNSGSGWLNTGGILNATDNYVEVPGLNTFGMFTLGQSTTPLPIQLAHFSAATLSNSNNVELTWGTLTETNNYGFYVQQSVGAPTSFVDVPNSFVPGHGTTVQPHEYSWIHNNVAAGTYFYRLKQVDLDGTIHYTDGVQVLVSPLAGMAEGTVPSVFALEQNFPNPFNPSTNIQFTVEKAGLTILNVYDVLGKEVATLYAGLAEPGKFYSASFDASHLTNGTYFYRLENGGQTLLKKMILLK